jgi:hypothetical protein
MKKSYKKDKEKTAESISKVGQKTEEEECSVCSFKYKIQGDYLKTADKALMDALTDCGIKPNATVNKMPSYKLCQIAEHETASKFIKEVK